MKNIFLIPTPNESRLWRDLDSNKLTFDNLSKPNSNECTKCSNEYVYITNDEEIKEGDWCHTIGTSLFNEQIGKVTKKVIEDNGKYGVVFKKIILTDNKDLIKDGIQPINDEFLEWFIKNLSCEEVEIGNQSIKSFDTGHFEDFYKIIILSEELLYDSEVGNKKIVIVRKKNSYSEEDMREAFIAGGNSNITEDDGYGSRYLKYMDKWFEQFKKIRL